MKEPKFIKFQYGKRISYQAIYKRNHLNIRLSNPYRRELRYRIFFNFNVIIEKDAGGKWFKQFHQTLISAKKEMSRYAQFKKAAPKFGNTITKRLLKDIYKGETKNEKRIF